MFAVAPDVRCADVAAAVARARGCGDLPDRIAGVRILVADCSVDYSGRLQAHLPRAKRVLLLKADGSLLVHSDGGSYKPLNWMSPPATLSAPQPSGEESAAGVKRVLLVENLKSADTLRVRIFEVLHETEHELGSDPGLQKDGVEAQLQELLAAQIELLGAGYTLVRREYMTAIGPVDILARDEKGFAVAVEIKRRGEIDGVEQLTRYLELLNRDPALNPVRGVFAAQQIKPQAQVLAGDRGIRCLTLDYDAMRGMKDPNALF